MRFSGFSLLLLVAVGSPLFASEFVSDNASDSAYDSGFSDGLNGGTGTGAWVISTTGANATSLTGNSISNGFGSGLGINTPGGGSGRAFALGASDGDVATATLPLSVAMNQGETISFGFDYGFLETGGVASAALQNASGEDILSISYTGGGNFDLTDSAGASDTLLGFSSDGFTVEITLDSTTTYIANITKLNDLSVATFSGSLISPSNGQTVDRVAFKADGLAPSGSGATSTDHYFYFNNIEVTADIDKASDVASDSTYDSGLSDGLDGGTGTGAWAITSASNSISLMGDSQANGFGSGLGVNTSGRAFGLGASDSETAIATLPFDAALIDGDVVSYGFDYGFVENGGITGVALLNASGEELVSITFTGGGNLDVNDLSGATNTGLNYTSDGFLVELTQESSTTYSVQITSLNDGSDYTGTGSYLSPTGGQVADRISFSANNVASSGNSGAVSNQFFFNSIIVKGPEPTTSLSDWLFLD